MKIMKLTFVLFLIIFLSCAVQGPPTGGEINNSSPKVISVYPINNKKNLKNDEVIIIHFNQMVNPTSAKTAFNIFPETDIIVSVKSNKIEIKPKNDWPENQFNIIGSRKISNYYGKNLSEIISLAYSTTELFSSYEVSGKLFNYDSTKTYEVGLFEKNHINENLNLIYKTEQNFDGTFKFSNIKNENYIVIALESRINNIKEDIRKFRYCLSKINIMNNSDKSINNNLFIYTQAERLALKSIDVINKYYGNIILSNGDKKPFISNDAFFDETFFNDKNFIKLNYPINHDSILVTTVLNNNVETYSTSKNLRLQHNVIDSIPPQLDYNILKNDSLFIALTEPVKIIDKNNVFYIGDDKEKIFLDFIYINPMLLGIDNLDDSTKIIKVINNKITDMMNNAFLDTSIIINNFSSSEENIFIGGNVYGDIIYSGVKDIVVELYNEKEKYKFVTANKNFFFIDVKPGIYNLWAYEDINKKSPNYFNGALAPFKNSAKFFIYNESIEVRSKWDMEGIKIKID